MKIINAIFTIITAIAAMFVIPLIWLLAFKIIGWEILVANIATILVGGWIWKCSGGNEKKD